MVRLKKTTLQTIKETFKNYTVYLFGSRTKNNVGSDIDLFIDEELSLKEVIKLKIGDRKMELDYRLKEIIYKFNCNRIK